MSIKRGTQVIFSLAGQDHHKKLFDKDFKQER